MMFEKNADGPESVVTPCATIPVQTHFTRVPFLTRTVGTPSGRTKKLSPTMTCLVTAWAGAAAGPSNTATRTGTKSFRTVGTSGVKGSRTGVPVYARRARRCQTDATAV